jgi:ribosomal protein L37E
MPYIADVLKVNAAKIAKKIGAAIAYPHNEMELTFNSVEDAESFIRELVTTTPVQKTTAPQTAPTSEVKVHVNGAKHDLPQQSCGAEIPNVADGNFCGYMERAAYEHKAACSACGMPVPKVLKDKYTAKKIAKLPGLRPTKFVLPPNGKQVATVDVYGPHVNVNAQRRIYNKQAKMATQHAKRLDRKINLKSTVKNNPRTLPQMIAQRNFWREQSARYTEAARLCGKTQVEHKEARKMKKTTAKKTTTAVKRTAPSAFADNAKITVVAKDLNCAKGTAKHKLRRKILKCRTVASALEAGLRVGNLKNMVADGTIKIAK